jgi:hypothetical protein
MASSHVPGNLLGRKATPKECFDVVLENRIGINATVCFFRASTSLQHVRVGVLLEVDTVCSGVASQFSGNGGAVNTEESCHGGV